MRPEILHAYTCLPRDTVPSDCNSELQLPLSISATRSTQSGTAFDWYASHGVAASERQRTLATGPAISVYSFST